MKNATANAMFSLSVLDALAIRGRRPDARRVFYEIGAMVARALKASLDGGEFQAGLIRSAQTIITTGAAGAMPLDDVVAFVSEFSAFEFAAREVAETHEPMRWLSDLLAQTQLADKQDGVLLLRLATYGFPEFRVFPDILDSLIRTSVRAPADAFRLPYPAFEILLPRNRSERWLVDGGDGTKYPARSVVFATGIDAHGRGPVLFCCIYGRPDDNTDENAQSFSIELRRVIGHAFITEAGLRDAICGGDKSRERMGINLELLRLGINMVLYIGSEGADIRQRMPGAPRVPPQGREHELREGQRDVGRRIAIPGAAAARGGGGALGARVLAFHWVRGHWHTYRVGEGRAETRIRWVQPYTKGGTIQTSRREYDVVVPADEPPTRETTKEEPE